MTDKQHSGPIQNTFNVVLSNFPLGVFFLVLQDTFSSFESQWGQVCPTSHTEYSGVSVVSIGFNNPRFEVVN